MRIEDCVLFTKSSKKVRYEKKEQTWGSTIQPWYSGISNKSNMAHSRVNSKSSILQPSCKSQWELENRELQVTMS